MWSIGVQFADSSSYLQPLTNKEDRFLEDLISRHAKTRPQHPAVRAWDGALTYEELVNATSRVACRLRAECGVKPGMLVPACFEKSICELWQSSLLSRLALGL
jgi:non-ribosomal peptide synthetase component E (peptide arylation enzyme)